MRIPQVGKLSFQHQACPFFSGMSSLPLSLSLSLSFPFSLSLPLSTPSYTVEARRRTYSPKLQCGGWCHWTHLMHMLPIPLYTLKWIPTLLTVEVDGYTRSLPCLMLGGQLIYLVYPHSMSLQFTSLED